MNKIKTVKFEVRNNIATITMNRPEALNALNNDFFSDMEILLNNIRKDNEIKILVITGEGKAFVSGADIAEMVWGVPPFPFVRESLEKLKEKADSIVVSQTPVEALTREWEENDIDKYVRFIAGQEYGTKTEHIALAATGKYPYNKILMVGDAPGDIKAAKKNGVLFFPVNPGHEDESWERFYKEALDRFYNNTYEGDYEETLIREFERFLPEKPPWNK